MATYTHFGKQPDVLKHLILCEVLRNEHPQVYVETNSACAIYPMQQTSEQQYGIYYFLEKTVEEDNQVLKDSIYYKIESAERILFRFSGFSNGGTRKTGTKISILRYRKECFG